MARFIVHYDRVTRIGVKRQYYREFQTAMQAFDYMEQKSKDERNENVRGFVHHELDGVTYVAKLSL